MYLNLRQLKIVGFYPERQVPLRIHRPFCSETSPQNIQQQFIQVQASIFMQSIFTAQTRKEIWHSFRFRTKRPVTQNELPAYNRRCHSAANLHGVFQFSRYQSRHAGCRQQFLKTSFLAYRFQGQSALASPFQISSQQMFGLSSLQEALSQF